MIMAVGSVIESQERAIDKDVQIGPDVRIKCRSVKVGAGCRIGIQNHANFREPAGIRIECEELELGPGCEIGRSVCMSGGRLVLGAGCRLGSGSTVRVTQELMLGKGCQLGLENTVEGRIVKVGRELWSGPQVRIGGGSCFEVQSSFTAGYWLHLGMRVFVNTARPVTVGNEVGIGTGSMIFTHGAYQSALSGYPVSFAAVDIGDNCWIPGAVLNPGVSIGRGAVIGVGSVVTSSIPAGCLAAGVPCKVLRENQYPRQLGPEERRAFLAGFLRNAAPILGDAFDSAPELDEAGRQLTVGARQLATDERQLAVQGEGKMETVFLLDERRIAGKADKLTEKLRDLLRRHGIRFFSEVSDGHYQDWPDGDCHRFPSSENGGCTRPLPDGDFARTGQSSIVNRKSSIP